MSAVSIAQGRFLTLFVGLAGCVAGQSPDAGRSNARPEFEAATVKPVANCDHAAPRVPSRGRFYLPCTTARKLIQIAYGTFNGSEIAAGKMDVIGGPSWLDKQQYEVNAVAPGPASVSAMAGPMLQRLLEDRFA